MRVLVITPWFPSMALPESGIFNLRDAELIAESHEVRVLHLIHPRLIRENEPAKSQLSANLSVTRVPFQVTKPGTWPGALKAIRVALSGADLLHSMAFPALLPLALTRVRIPWIHTEHWGELLNPADSHPLKRFGMRVLKQTLRGPDQVVAVSQSLAKAIAPFCRRTPTAISNEVMTPRNSEVSRPPAANEDIRLIAVGGVAEHKGPLQAVETLKVLRDRGVLATLKWIGDGDLRATAEQEAQTLGVAQWTNFAGRLEPETIVEQLLNSHVFLLPTKSETFGVAIAEALVCGLPVVVTGTGGHEEFVTPDNGRITDRSPERIADGVQEVLAPGGVKTPSEIAANARAEFSRDARKEAYAAVYKHA